MALARSLEGSVVYFADVLMAITQCGCSATEAKFLRRTAVEAAVAGARAGSRREEVLLRIGELECKVRRLEVCSEPVAEAIVPGKGMKCEDVGLNGMDGKEGEVLANDFYVGEVYINASCQTDLAVEADAGAGPHSGGGVLPRLEWADIVDDEDEPPVPEVMLEVFKNPGEYGMALQYASHELKGDREVVQEAAPTVKPVEESPPARGKAARRRCAAARLLAVQERKMAAIALLHRALHREDVDIARQ